jgi:hypothetical protein
LKSLQVAKRHCSLVLARNQKRIHKVFLCDSQRSPFGFLRLRGRNYNACGPGAGIETWRQA